jgi:LmbE family N-acetylglucosaminyl deacetylase
MYEFTRRGDRVIVVTATPGEHGTADPDTWPPARLAERRRAELAASLATLGVDEHHILGYEDGRCADVDGTLDFASFITDVDPDIIVTFGPDGLTGHPDHRSVSAWATRAHAITASRAQLWYATLTPDFHREWARVNEFVGLFNDQPEPPSIERSALAYTVQLGTTALDVKLRALQEHRSQTSGLIELVGIDRYRDWWRTETFRPAGTQPDDLRVDHLPELQGAHA